jgi:hypothetical protein
MPLLRETGWNSVSFSTVPNVGAIPTTTEGFAMRIADLNWMQVEAYLQRENRGKDAKESNCKLSEGSEGMGNGED